MSVSHDNPASAWSRRRAAVRAEEEALKKAEAAKRAARAQAQLEEKSDEEILRELNLPDPEQLKEGDDFAAFMTAAVPERIRRRALRTLWRSNPVLANVDSLVDYGEDFASEGAMVGAIRTTYQVGKGMLKHIEALEDEEMDEAGEAVAEAGKAAPAVEAEEPTAEDEVEFVVAQTHPNADPDPDPTPVPRRRMRFAFTE